MHVHHLHSHQKTSRGLPFEGIMISFSNIFFSVSNFFVVSMNNVFLSNDEFGSLRRSSLTQEANKHRLLFDILPSKPMSMFPAFCNILHSVGQSDVAVKLEQNVVHDNRLLQG